MSQRLSYINIEPNEPANAVLIWLHGLGASGNDLAPLAQTIQCQDGIALRYIFPHAPHRPVSINGGASMPAWYDLEIHGHERKVVSEDLQASSEQILAIIEEQMAQGIASERIIIAGFSQGGAVTYETLFRCPHALAGAMPMSTYIGHQQTLTQAAHLRTPIWVSHGTQDDVVPFELGLRALQSLTGAGFEPEFSEYPMAHNICPSQVKDIQTFINTVLG